MNKDMTEVWSKGFVPEGNRASNVDRFTGFEDTYDQHRPEAPQEVVSLLTGYLERKPSLVVDLGCGTGLSSFAWKDAADQVIGVEPNDDMRGKAMAKLQSLQEESDGSHGVQLADIRFVSGYSNQLALPDRSADIITCSQSFHWMDPASTLKEVSRVLREEGIFAVYDCDWPPSLTWKVEQSYHELIEWAEAAIDRHVEAQEKAYKGNKNEHLKHIRESGVFRFSKEIVFHHIEPFTAERYTGLAVSQGGIQTVFKLKQTELNDKIAQFHALVGEHFQGRTLPVMLSYRMRLGIK
ncbi:class I SAM-dependent methyltransferase [Paenibacillus sp. MDMC362]|uniref:class I SAM-dependent methyltransferase n=1 Tax=Paenibacillus sp. MDMC362 TaxID=2977365 RepID=UPI000DC27BA6|nr:class I SAM-dependent methyltransferase [Paenibacillus sp. MDMC362]RAR44506.1 SAM-dependent methyltransferase [Paenibacillus sp. MDMC362]